MSQEHNCRRLPATGSERVLTQNFNETANPEACVANTRESRQISSHSRTRDRVPEWNWFLHPFHPPWSFNDSTSQGS